MADSNTAAAGSDEYRETMAKYWSEHKDCLTNDAMMLDDNSAAVDAGDQEEVLAMLPDLAGKDVCEVGSGIGRFTTRLLEDKKVGTLQTSDFMEAYALKNQEVNSKYNTADQKVVFATEDVTKKDFGIECFDHVFTNWLFMYLSDDETRAVFGRILDSLRPGGTFFLRESCFRQSGSKARSFNPTEYRSDTLYEQLVADAPALSANSAAFKFRCDQRNANQTYIKVKNNENQLMWIFTKVAADAAGSE